MTEIKFGKLTLSREWLSKLYPYSREWLGWQLRSLTRAEIDAGLAQRGGRTLFLMACSAANIDADEVIANARK